jgi:hypothetical protein
MAAKRATGQRRAEMGTEAKHTPGPWTVAPREGGDDIAKVVANYSEQVGDDGGTIQVASWIAELDSGIDFGDEGCDEGIRKREEMVANARLIAAAPELLEACRTAKRYLEPDLVEPGRTVFWSLVAAIAKAEGRP